MSDAQRQEVRKDANEGANMTYAYLTGKVTGTEKRKRIWMWLDMEREIRGMIRRNRGA